MQEASINQKNIQLDRVVFFGRTLAEYLKFFDLDLSEWQGGKILDCPTGAASFVAEANKMGISAVGCDPLFALEPQVLLDRGQADIEHVVQRVAQFPDLYNWDFYQSIDGFKEYRTLAFQRFAEDYADGMANSRYINAELPKLPFANRSFDLVLSGHFLFTYSQSSGLMANSPFDYLFHLHSIKELLRVSSQEVRIYPIQSQDRELHEYVEPLVAELKDLGVGAEIVNVLWEFKKGSNQMLRLIC